MNPSDREPQSTAARLGLWDTTSILVGIIVGVGIYLTPSSIFSNVAGPWQAIGLWVAAGLLCLVGAFCFAELASTYPRSGGEYVYLTRAYGPGMGFLFAWTQLVVIRTAGSVSIVAYYFATYASKLFNLDPDNTAAYVVLAVLPLVVLTAVNIVGVTFGKTTQNVLTALKVAGLAGILVVGFGWGRPIGEENNFLVREGQVVHAGGGWLVLRDHAGTEFGAPVAADARITQDGKKVAQLADLSPGMPVKVLLPLPEAGQIIRVKASTSSAFAGLVLALIFILWSYAGWHEGAYVASEVRNPRRTLPLALFLGTGAVMVIYVLINLAYLAGLGFEAAGDSQTIAADILALALGKEGAWIMSVLVMVSALGAMNGMIFTSSRIFAEMGADHPLFAPLGRWHARWRTPVLSLLLQGSLCIAAVVAAGCWWGGMNGLDALFKYTAAVFWLFFLLTGIAFFVLRIKDPERERPFTVPAYPLVPLLFCACCAFMLYGSVQMAPLESLVGLGIVATGLPLYFVSRSLGSTRHKDQPRQASARWEQLVETSDRA